MTHAELLTRISSRELSEWMALYSIEMFGQDRVELLLAQLLALTANVHRGDDDEPMSAMDFMPWWPVEQAERDVQSPEQMLALIEALNAAMGGRDLRGGSEPEMDEPDGLDE